MEVARSPLDGGGSRQRAEPWGCTRTKIDDRSHPMTKQSPPHCLRAPIRLEQWVRHTPSVAALRPQRCPACRVVGQPLVGRPLIIGHGQRSRRVRTPLSPDSPIREVTIVIRRYLCRPCGTIIQVQPAEVLPQARFSVTAMARAVALVGLGGCSFAQAREKLGQGSGGDWASLRRWHRALSPLGPTPRSCVAGTARQRAERVAVRLLAHAPTDLRGDVCRRVEIGATWASGAPWRCTSPSPTTKDQVSAIVEISGSALKRLSRGGSGMGRRRPSPRSRRRAAEEAAFLKYARSIAPLNSAESPLNHAVPSNPCTAPVTLSDAHRERDP